MPVLSDADLLEALRRKSLGIEPFSEASLTPNGYDLRVGEVFLPEDGKRVDFGRVAIPGHARFLVSTLEYLRMPPHLTGQLWIRSSFARKGLLAGFGKVEAGFEGTLTIGAFNAAREPVDLGVGERFCQIAFEGLSRPAEKAYGQRGHYQGQRGVTLARE